MTNVFEYLFPCDANNGDVIIKQGDEGDNFYIIDEVKCFLPHKIKIDSSNVSGLRGYLCQ